MRDNTSSHRPIFLHANPAKKALPKKAVLVAVVIVFSMITAVLTAVTLTDQDPATLSAFPGPLASIMDIPSLLPEEQAGQFAEFFDRSSEDLVAAAASSPSDRERLLDESRAIYENRRYRLAWTGGAGPILQRARAFLTLLNQPDRHGLDPRDYRADELARDVKSLELNRDPAPEDRFSLELRLTMALIDFTRDLHGGRIEAVQLTEWHKDPTPVDVADLVTQALAAEDRRQLAYRLEPTHEPYRRLAARAVDYRRLVDDGGWSTLPHTDTLESGDTVEPELYTALVDRLLAEGDLTSEALKRSQSATEGSLPRYDAELSQAVANFQRRHGLDVDGKLGKATRAAMNVSAAERLRQIEANLERWRWLPHELPADRIEVNVPAFELRGYRDGKPEIEMAVAVGKPDWATPIFEAEVLYAEVNPYWNVPESIAVDEVLPALRKDPTYLEQENMEVVPGWAVEQELTDLADIDWNNPGTYGADYRIRQRPGHGNALGQIKFIFPNRHNIYLHDTPAQKAFEKADRAVSHGCVRVADPLRLADFLFAGETLAEVRASLGSDEPQQVHLEKPIPVMLHYWTAFVDDDGRMSFREDLYGLDGEVGVLLADVSNPVLKPATIDEPARRSVAQAKGVQAMAVTTAP